MEQVSVTQHHFMVGSEVPPLTVKHNFKLSVLLDVLSACMCWGLQHHGCDELPWAPLCCEGLHPHHHLQPWSRCCPTSETCCICALYGAVRTQLEKRFEIIFFKARGHCWSREGACGWGCPIWERRLHGAVLGKPVLAGAVLEKLK